MPSIYRGKYFEVTFMLEQRANAQPLDISTWEFAADFRVNRDDEATVLETSTSGGHWSVVTEAGISKLRFVLTEAQTAALPLGAIVGDVDRTDDARGDLHIFELSIPVLEPITR